MERVFLKELEKVKAVEYFLNKSNLKLDPYIHELYVIYEKDEIVASGAIFGRVLKCIAVSNDQKGTNLINTVMSFLMNRSYELGNINLFIYTKPCSYKSFEYFGFKKIAQSENVILLENNECGIDAFIDNLEKSELTGKIGSVVVNCNPFTLGHKHLIESAAKSCDLVHVFVVWEDQSTFPNDIRLELVKAGLAHLDNVIIHKGEDYIISAATFPSYFIKSDDLIVEEHTKLDLNLFSKTIAKTLDIKYRFVGEEPFNKTTERYNQAMQSILEEHNIELTIIPRIESNEIPISASKVRALLNEGAFSEIKEIVPPTTYEYLISERAIPIIEKIKKAYNKEKLV